MRYITWEAREIGFDTVRAQSWDDEQVQEICHYVAEHPEYDSIEAVLVDMRDLGYAV